MLYGTGRQIFGAIILFISYYVLSLPIGIPLMFLSERGQQVSARIPAPHIHTHTLAYYVLLLMFPLMFLSELRTARIHTHLPKDCKALKILE